MIRSALCRAYKAQKAPTRGFSSSSKLCGTSTHTGEILPMPQRKKFGLFGIVCAVVPGLLIGATISKKMANFLEETELFVPSDDDDDDDD